MLQLLNLVLLLTDSTPDEGGVITVDAVTAAAATAVADTVRPRQLCSATLSNVGRLPSAWLGSCSQLPCH